MSLSKFLMSRKFLNHFILAALLLFVLLLITMQALKIYTRHGQANPVPDFSGMTESQAQETARNHSLNIKIIDSLYVKEAPPRVVVDQLPKPDNKVKQNRTIFLTINSTQPEQVTLPQLTDISFRQAKALIENSGLTIGHISYRPSEYSDLVLEVQKDSAALLPGQRLPKGSSIDLVVGRREGDQITNVPNLTGLTIQEAKMTLTGAMLNTGVIIYDESVLSSEDSIQAKVWRQQPNPAVTATTVLGTSIDLWVTADSLKIEDANEIFF